MATDKVIMSLILLVVLGIAGAITTYFVKKQTNPDDAVCKIARIDSILHGSLHFCWFHICLRAPDLLEQAKVAFSINNYQKLNK
jgi:hypothetical protein